jgi:hypothetical protein
VNALGGRWLIVIGASWALLGAATIIIWARSHSRPVNVLDAGIASIGLAIAYLTLRVRRSVP